MISFFDNLDWDMVWEATGSTVYMTAIAGVSTFVLGLIIGLLLYATNEELLFKNRAFYSVLSLVVNVFRSIPFIILLILLIPFTTAIVGSFLGPTAALPALIFGAAPFYGRMVELALREVDKGVIEAAESMGATKFQIIYKVLIPEALPAIVSGITVTLVSLVGYTAMAGVVGGGGLGDMAFIEGFQRSQNDVIVIATLLILAIVFVIQIIGDLLIRAIDKR
ncbi:methionine ABC transporter permease [Exiguobacterium sp. Leaf187]|jgi:D-methionine transport system permease protein|uniref:Methionine ABC transporter permease n=3 Tax=Exiguobacterium TaxID=33986 RepID=A0A0V8GIV9_9BACL|nr:MULTISPECIES: methionine ABC transporter permease [Exiguobacterium]AHA30545.1 methionine import system permease MetP [Exiguobacterium sp. MH3]KQS19778.1 methionine ABC transporter permease [Exiguobacterium sp. Leaf187]KSU50213.1 methionine ABC transporter permease [Exiguobacterium enclense]KTR26096.1 methionine ABC transporter permease [Exiguobacterium indicum]MBF8152095.1 ABC transporter permease [Exiguobacterium sp. TBG-PICH-001]